MTGKHFLKSGSAFLIFLFSFSAALSQQAWKKELLSYIGTKLHKPDGGYGWEDQYDSHLTPTYAVTGILYHIGELPDNKAALAEFIRTHHPQRKGNTTGSYFLGAPPGEAGPSGSNMRNLVYEQMRAILWLGGDVSPFIEELRSWKSQSGVLANYESNGFGGLFQETMTPICHHLAGIEMLNGDKFAEYLESCRRRNGSFNNAPASFGGDGNILNTWWALYAFKSLGVSGLQDPETVKWLQSCQLKNGGFTHQPDPVIGANDDIAYTWAGIKALKLLGAKPADTKAAVSYILSLRNNDGGFGNRPGLHSTPVASFYAIESLAELGMLSALDKSGKANRIEEEKPDFTGYRIFTVQFQAHGQGSPKEAVMLADSLNIDLWGVKYPVKGWIKEARRIAAQMNVPVTFFMSNEPHDNLVTVPGMGSFNHVLDYIAPVDEEVPFAENASFEELRNTTLKQLKELNGGLMLQVSNNEPLARLLIDESINNNHGYLALHTIHFGQNFMFWLPYLAEYRYRLPLVTLQDAHGTESWVWADELANHRNLFIAKEPTYDEMVKSLKKNWIVGVRHDSVSNFRTRMLGGTEAARKFISDNETAWKWWSGNRLKRPLAALTIVRPDDLFEAGTPGTGVNVRVRCRWNGVRQTLKTRSAVLQELRIDGKAVHPEEKIVRMRNTVSDAYYLYEWGDPAKGKHTVEVDIRDLRTGNIRTYSAAYIQE